MARSGTARDTTSQAATDRAESAVVVLESASARETKAWGRRLGLLLEGGELVGLRGELGAGKTCFIKGLARGLHLREEDILSPSFTMIQEHHGRLTLYHVDLYRLETVELNDLGLREYLFSPAVAAVEWFDRLTGGGELSCLSVTISFAGANCRRIELRAGDDRYRALIARLRSRFL